MLRQLFSSLKMNIFFTCHQINMFCFDIKFKNVDKIKWQVNSNSSPVQQTHPVLWTMLQQLQYPNTTGHGSRPASNYTLVLSTMQCRAVQCSSVQCIASECSLVHCSWLVCNATCCIAAYPSLVQLSAVQLSALQYGSPKGSSVQWSGVKLNAVHCCVVFSGVKYNEMVQEYPSHRLQIH